MSATRRCAVLLATICFTPSAALAVGACLCNDTAWALPHGRAVPLNTRVFVRVPDQGPFAVRLQQGTVDVPVDVVSAGGGPQNMWISAKRPLTPGASYALEVRSSRPDAGAGAALAMSFTAVPDAGGIDLEPPVVSGLSTEPGGLGSSCNFISAAGTVRIQSIADRFSGGAAVVQLDLRVADRTERLFLPYFGTAPGWHDGVGVGADRTDSGRDCLGDRRLQGGAASGSYAMKVTVWDWAGNATVAEGLELSLAANPVRPAMPGFGAGVENASERGGGCSLKGDANPATASTALLGALYVMGGACRWRRRRELYSSRHHERCTEVR